MARIAVVDDKEILRESLAATLEREDHETTVFADPVEACGVIKQGRYDLALVDLKMPRMDGLTLIRTVRDAGCDTPIIMMTAYATVSTAVEAMKLGAVDYIQKPFEADTVAVLVDRSLETARLRRDNEALRTSVEDLCQARVMVGSGVTMTRLRDQVERVAASHATVLITGESGTGKELVAAHIHRLSPRGDRPMLCLNCAALSASLLEASCSGTNVVRSPARTARGADGSSWRTVGRCCSTKYPRWRYRFRRSSSVCFRRGSTSALVAARRAPPMFA